MGHVRLREELQEVVCHFEELEDPRSSINRLHPLESVIVITIMAILAGASGPTAIARWAKLKTGWLEQILDLPAGIPAKDVYRRVLMVLDPLTFQVCFSAWLLTLRQLAEEAGDVQRSIFAVDGKTARRSHDKKKGLGSMHSVSVWASDIGLSLGQVVTEEKSNEITAIPEVLKLVDLSGAIITIDAMGTQTAIAKQIIAGGGDYVLALKDNQGTIYKAVVEHFSKQLDTDFKNVISRRHITHEVAHGREEARHYIQLPIPKALAGRDRWAGLKTIGIAMLACVRDGKETYDCRYFLSSLPMGVKQFARAVRGHWGIENSCHWTLDMTFREDESRVREVNLRENFAWLNRFALSLLNQHEGPGSVAMKRRSCGWSDDYLLQVLTTTAT